MDYKVIHRSDEKSLEIRDYSKPIPEVYELIANQVWGTSGPIFTKNYTDEKINAVVNPHFLLVFDLDNNFIGMCTLSERKMGFKNQYIDAFYLQAFSIKEEYQGEGIGKWFLEESRKYFTSIIVEPTVSYATIEGKNHRSSRVADFIKYDYVSYFNTCIFSRVFPKKLKGVSHLDEVEIDKMIPILKNFYSDHCYVHFSYMNGDHPYLVLKKNDEILAGLQVHRQFWEFKSLPGFQGKIIMNVVPLIPILNRVFNPKYRFIVFEAMYYKEGEIHSLIRLMEHALAEFKVNSAMLWLDPRSKVYIDLESNTEFGLVDKLEGKTPVSMHAHLHHNTPVTWDEMVETPMYVSGYDCV